jgi:hypothetical protein
MDIQKEKLLSQAITNYVESMTREQLEDYVTENKTEFFWPTYGEDVPEEDVDDFLAEYGSKIDLTSKKDQVLKFISEGTLLLTTDQVTMQDTLEEAMNLMSGITTSKELMSLISSTTFASGDEKVLNRQKVVEFLNTLRLEDSSTAQVSSISDRKHPFEIDKIFHLDKFETPGSLERQIIVENALFEYIENNDFTYSDINSYNDGGWKFFTYDTPDLRIHGRDFPAKILVEAIDTYMAKNNILDSVLSDAVKDIRSQYQSYKSQFEYDTGFCDSHKDTLNIDLSRDRAYNFLLNNEDSKQIIADLPYNLAGATELCWSLIKGWPQSFSSEDDGFSTSQVKQAGDHLLANIKDLFDGGEIFSEETVSRSIADAFHLTHSKHFNQTPTPVDIPSKPVSNK